MHTHTRGWNLGLILVPGGMTSYELETLENTSYLLAISYSLETLESTRYLYKIDLMLVSHPFIF